jgi:uncharacterized protein YjgD (DUF1641 family)
MKINDILLESSIHRITIPELLHKYPELEKTNDLNEVVGWFHNAHKNDLEFYLSKEPMSKFINQAKEMVSTFDEFPQDAKRTKKIVKRLREGNDALPIFVEYGDPYNFIMEGRHRVVAFMQMGYDFLPVVYVKDIR